jgi:radical SAM enzyme (TIGR01210 family)
VRQTTEANRVLPVPTDSRELARWITAQRPAGTSALDLDRPHAFFLEDERMASGKVVGSGAILLTNKECPWRCLMCDLWKNTTKAPVPAGAIPRQIEFALDVWRNQGATVDQIKLYNSGSFFDSAAIPPGDYPAIAHAIAFAKNVVVESHPRLVGQRALRLRDLLLTGALEVAMGLETAHPGVLERLNKKFTLTHFADAARFLRSEGIAVRAFVLVKPPFMDEAEGLEWAVKSAHFAFSCGANVVSLIPTRPGNGAMDRLLESGEWSPPKLSTLEKAFQSALALNKGRVFADTWNLEMFSSCAECFEQRLLRLREINLNQRDALLVQCPHCNEL